MAKELTAQDVEIAKKQLLCRAHAAFWAKEMKVRLANGQYFDTAGREYQIDWLLPPKIANERCYMKATGAGVSDGEILESIHGMLTGRYRQGVLYGFPNDADMMDYSKTRWNPLIQLNYTQIGKYLSEGRKKTDAADVKRICNSNLYLRGMRMIPTADGESRQSVKATGIHVDKAVLDEVDQMELEIVGKVRGRMSNARIGGVKGKSYLAMIGNPSDEDRGIDSIWQGSDQRYWFRECECGGKTCAELEFWNDPEKCVGLYPDRLTRLENHQPLGYIRCVKCGKPVGQRRGKWIPTKPENKEREGYNWSYLTSENQDPAYVLKCYRNPPENNLGDVIRLMLGKAYSSSDEKLRKDMVWACCSNEGIPDTYPGPCCMGVDNDDKKHVVILARTGNQKYRMVKFCVCEDFNQVLDLIPRFHIKFCVGDLRPNADSARQFQKIANAKGCRTFLCEYTESPLQDFTFLDDRGIVKVYRTGIFDASHRVFSNNDIVLPRRTKDLDEFAQQCCNCVKSKEIDKRKRTVVYRYKKTGAGNDHYRNALNYAIVAANKVGRSRENVYYERKIQDCIMEYSAI
ncbi:MAG: phage terminase large subunit family protein [Dehalococcoidia bacterium]|nr:phage terminase large subunit family protein [Candidatus Neomarinimicrobiota bacterium]MCK9518353.1 phage terminase large subunit family protein [Dehalococcoidia bacterium]